MAEAIRIVPANAASWEDVQAVFGQRGEPARCQCQWFRVPAAEFRGLSAEDRQWRHREQVGCDEPRSGGPQSHKPQSHNPQSGETSGLIAYLDDEPAGWCAVAPRPEYPHLRTQKVPWTGRAEDKDDAGVWAVTCFVTRVGFRRRGISRALTAATVDFARRRGARALEAYPLVLKPGEQMTWGELYVGERDNFVAAGFREVSRPTARRVVMRVEF
ncbi:MAG TPA: GNAT family N-acetyltransferase [Actinocrinis sp.]|nr:GNAT family N-acetyltransferase [Actinocrinis sp.]